MQRRDDAAQGGLPAPRLADQAEGLTAADLEANAVHRPNDVAADPTNGEVLHDILDPQDDGVDSRVDARFGLRSFHHDITPGPPV